MKLSCPCDNPLLFTIWVIFLLSLLDLSFSLNFSELFQPYWAPDHMAISDDAGDGSQPLLKLALDNTSGCGFMSKKKYLFGQATMQIKLVEGDSAGTVTAFYLSSDGSHHDELDFEFLGNVSGKPYLVQTNVYVNGTGDREQRHSLWFDPTADFHTYAVLWNRWHVRFLVDGIPIRVFSNIESAIVPYPKDQPMGVYASVWNADDWATQGGRVKTNWTHAPFVTQFRGIQIDACDVDVQQGDKDGGGTSGDVSKCGSEGNFWWDAPVMAGLTPHQRRQLKWIRVKHLIYDYCRDTARFVAMPAECNSAAPAR